MQHSWKPPRGILKSINSSEILKAVGYIVMLVGIFYGLTSYVDSLVDKRLKDREVIERLARIIRPSMIFDSNESTIADLGASEYIESIKIVKYKDQEKKIPVVIEVKSKNT
jgi:hypothetical protein